jgi:hypothetical protein
LYARREKDPKKEPPSLVVLEGDNVPSTTKSWRREMNAMKYGEDEARKAMR